MSLSTAIVGTEQPPRCVDSVSWNSLEHTFFKAKSVGAPPLDSLPMLMGKLAGYLRGNKGPKAGWLQLFVMAIEVLSKELNAATENGELKHTRVLQMICLFSWTVMGNHWESCSCYLLTDSKSSLARSLTQLKLPCSQLVFPDKVKRNLLQLRPWTSS